MPSSNPFIGFAFLIWMIFYSFQAKNVILTHVFGFLDLLTWNKGTSFYAFFRQK